MQTLDYMSIENGVCRYFPEGEVTLVEGVELVTNAIAYCCAENFPMLLVNLTRLHGHAVPTLVDRFWMAQDWAQASQGRVTVAAVARIEDIDPGKFGVTAANDAGLTCDVFTDEHAAAAWLAALSQGKAAPDVT